VVAAFFGFRALTQGNGPEKLSLDRYTQDLKSGKVASATIHDKDHTVSGKLTNGTEYTVDFPGQYTARLTQAVVDADVKKFDTDHQSQSTWVSLLYGLLPFALLALVLMWALGQVQGGGSRVMGFGKARAKTMSKDQPKVTFADVAGLDEAVEELEEIKEFLESPAKFQQMCAKIPKGVPLYGPPGTGKTLLKPGCRSSPSAVPTSWRCSWASARHACATCSSRRSRRRRRSCSSTRSTPSVVTAAPGSAAATTNGSRRSTSSWSRWTASTRSRG
jgi:ATP-dependent Zn protease